ncbi:unnamed protein product [Cochlearia groenlandica]
MFSPHKISYKLSPLSNEAKDSSSYNTLSTNQSFSGLNKVVSSLCINTETHNKIKKRRGVPGNPDPDAEVIALSPKTLLATNRFICEICNKGFQRDQNLQLHRRGHNLPWKLKQKNNNNNKEQQKKKVYVCPETKCVHNQPSRALGDLTGIKKHFCRKHGEKKWKCEKCSKFYAVQSDWKAHTKICGTREYRCDCGTLFSRKDSFITHRAFCDALAEETSRIISLPSSSTNNLTNPNPTFQQRPFTINKNPNNSSSLLFTSPHSTAITTAASPSTTTTAALSATSLLQKATTAMSSGAFRGGGLGHHHHIPVNEFLGVDQVMMMTSSPSPLSFGGLLSSSTWRKGDDNSLTRDFLGITGQDVHVSVRPNDMLEYAGCLAFPISAYDSETRHHVEDYDMGFSGAYNM